MTFALESGMDMLSQELGIDPADMRLRNGLKTGEVSLHGWKIGSSGLE
jgi:CO/xanthine dehydrogenase Mo-binding subunit